MDSENKPVGGKWSFDEDNRKKIPQNINLPDKFYFNETENTKSLKKLIKKKFSDHPGKLETFYACTTREDVNTF